MIQIQSLSLESTAYKVLPAPSIRFVSFDLEDQKAFLNRITFVIPAINGLEVNEVLVAHDTENELITTNSTDELAVNRLYGSNYTNYTVTINGSLEGFEFSKKALITVEFE